MVVWIDEGVMESRDMMLDEFGHHVHKMPNNTDNKACLEHLLFSYY